MWIVALSTFPLILEIIKLSKPEWSSWLLPLSVYCGFIGTIMLLIMLRIKFFSAIPVARNIVLDTIQEGIVVVNANGKVIDSNKQASVWFLEMGYTAVHGRRMEELLETWPEWLDLCRSMQQGRVEID